MTRSHIFVFIVTAFSVVACVLVHICSVVSHPSLRTAQGGIIILTLCLKALHLGTVCVCLAWSSLLSRCCCCVGLSLLRSGSLTFDFFLSETGKWRSTGSEIRSFPYHWFKTAILLFHDGMKKLQRWNHLISE